MRKEEFSKIEKYLKEGEIEKVIDAFEELLEKHPQNLSLRLAFANFLLKIEDPFYALDVLREGLKIDSENLELRYLFGVAQQKVNRFHLAEKEFEFIKSQRPFDLEVKRQLGWTKVMKGEIEEGRKLLREVISADLMNPLAYSDLGASYIFTLDFEEGLRWLETAKNLNPKDSLVLERIERAKKMKDEFEKFSKKDQKIMRKMRNDPQELKMMAIETMLALQAQMEPTKEEMEDVKKELELAGLNPKFVEVQLPKTKREKTIVEYLKYHSKVENAERKISQKEFQKLKEKLLKSNDEEEIKKVLIVLAHQGTKQAVALLEKYQKIAPANLKDFTKLALEECKILLKAPPGKMIKIIH